MYICLVEYIKVYFYPYNGKDNTRLKLDHIFYFPRSTEQTEVNKEKKFRSLEKGDEMSLKALEKRFFIQ